MIQLCDAGTYVLYETKSQTKILTLGKKSFAWINAGEVGEILVNSGKPHKTDCILAMGKYRVYIVKNEPKLTDLLHLELFVGEGKWQGYLLTTGLPTDSKKRKRIIPTNEIISKTSTNLKVHPQAGLHP